jgi:hypothetical protein
MKRIQKVKNLVRHRDFLPILIVLLFAYLAARPLFGSGYFNMHDDLQMMRQLEMEKCFLDGQIPCRWVPDMGYGYGFPLFNYYPPLPYLVGQTVRLVGYSFVDTAKAMFIFAFLASGITMYFLGREFFGRKGGTLASIFYIWAPYHAVDIYVRGAMNEAWAMIWFPLLLLFSYKVITNPPKKLNGIWLSLSLCGLLLSHNLMVMIFSPVLATWCVFWIVYTKNWKTIIDGIISGVLGVGLAAFFTIPVFLEQGLVHADSLVLGYYEFTAHFASISQILFSRFWGYGPSVWGTLNDKMSFQIGHMHWIGAGLIFILIVLYILRKRKFPPWLLTTVFSLLFAAAAAFMIHSRSTPIWLAIPPLKYVQFPWRFLTLVILGFSLSIGSLTFFIPRKIKNIFFIVISLVLVIFNKDYFLPEHGKLGPLTDEQKFSGAAWDLQRTAGIYDYLPKSAKENPKDGANTVAEVINGEAQILNPTSGTNWVNFTVDNTSPSTTLRINRYEFPNWQVFVDDQKVTQTVPEEERWGRMYITVPQGTHEVVAKLYNTPVRIVSNIISLISWAILALILFKKLRRLGLSR